MCTCTYVSYIINIMCTFPGDVVYDVSADLDVTVETVDLAEPVRRGLRQTTDDLYDNFAASQCQVIANERSPPSFDLQCLLYRKVMDHVTEGVHLHLPSPDTPIPGLFGLRGSVGRCVNSDDGDNISIASGNSKGGGAMAMLAAVSSARQQADTLSISSGGGGGKVPPRSHSGSVGNVSDSGSEFEVEPEADDEDDEEPQGIYEDIEDLRDDLEDARESIRKEAESVGVAAATSKSPKDKKKAPSFLKYLKKKTTKKGKDKGAGAGGMATKAPGVDLEFHEEDEDADGDGGGGPVPIPPTETHSSNESYDEMGAGNAGYISDNYEDVGFEGEATVRSIDADDEPAPPLPLSLSLPQGKPLKGKMLQRGAIQKASQPQAMSSTTDDLLGVKEKKRKLKEQLLAAGSNSNSNSRSATLPRKMKLSTGEKKPLLKIPSPTPELEVVLQQQGKERGKEQGKSMHGHGGQGVSAAVEATDGGGKMMPDVELSGKVWALRNEMERLKAQVQELAATVEMLRGQNSGGGGGWGSGTSEGGVTLREAQGEEEKEANMRALKTMTSEQVK